jgi:histidyl-tRNA synthetase
MVYPHSGLSKLHFSKRTHTVIFAQNSLMSKPSIPKGTRDFTPKEMLRRQFIFETIRGTFRQFGFMPIETPAMENLSTLTGKYGEEGDQLIFKLLNNGDFLSKADEEALAERNSKKLSFSISKKALRYDLTVPFARFVVMNQNEIAFPFKRYQIQPVWRGDRPGKGRYQEFFQCDADVVGTSSLLCEVELIQIFDQALTKLGIPDFTIKLNNRKILAGVAQHLGVEDNFTDLTVAIDKLDKIGIEGVEKELAARGFSDSQINGVKQLLQGQSASSTNEQKLKWIKGFLGDNVQAKAGIEEVEFVLNYMRDAGVADNRVKLDLTLARGLNYYTGAIFEVVANNVQIGSICGGGRYDDLTGIFGLPDVSGVGISFGADRIYDVLNELGCFPEDVQNATDLFLINFGEEEERYCIKLMRELRAKGLSVELYPEAAKMKKQMKYANDRGFKQVAMIGSREMETGVIAIKNMITGEQNQVERSEIQTYLSDAS